MLLISTRWAGKARRSFIIGMRLWPPARTLASSPSSARVASASSRDAGAEYSNAAGYITPPRWVGETVPGTGGGRGAPRAVSVKPPCIAISPEPLARSRPYSFAVRHVGPASSRRGGSRPPAPTTRPGTRGSPTSMLADSRAEAALGTRTRAEHPTPAHRRAPRRPAPAPRSSHLAIPSRGGCT